MAIPDEGEPDAEEPDEEEPDEFPDEEEPDGFPDEETEATPTVASAIDTTASGMTADSLATLAATAGDTVSGTTTASIVSAADTVATVTALNAEDQPAVAGATVFHLNATSVVHDLDSEEYASGDQQDLTSFDNSDSGIQQSSVEPRGSPVEEASAAVVPTPITAFLELNRIQDEASGITARMNNNSLLSSSLSSASEDYESSSDEEDAIDGVTKQNRDRSVKNNLSSDQLSSGKLVDVFSVICSICHDRFWDSVCIPCGHVGCRQCIEQWLPSSDPHRCHMCRRIVHWVQTPVVLCDFSSKPCFNN